MNDNLLLDDCKECGNIVTYNVSSKLALECPMHSRQNFDHVTEVYGLLIMFFQKAAFQCASSAPNGSFSNGCITCVVWGVDRRL